MWVKSRYAKSYAPTVYCYARKFSWLLDGNLEELENFTRPKRGAVLRALTTLSKYVGVYEEFKQRMKNYGMRWECQSSFDSFLRIMRNGNSDVMEWVKRCLEAFDRPYATFTSTSLKG